MSPSTNRFEGLLEKAFAVVLLLFGAVALSLFLIFHFIATTQIGALTGMSLFVLVTVLLIAGYMLDIVALGFLAIHLLPEYYGRKSKSRKTKAKNPKLVQVNGIHGRKAFICTVCGSGNLPFRACNIDG